MGGYSASSANVNFQFDQALQAARDLYSLSGVVDDKATSWDTECGNATDGWIGGHRDSFNNKRSTAGTSATRIKNGLVTLADRFATQWAKARGEQDRINFARYVQAQKDDDSWGDNVVEFFAGEDDYGEPPGDPDPPRSPDYQPTRSPMYAEYENQGVAV